MGKKIVKIDGKTFLVDSDTKMMEEIQLDVEEEAKKIIPEMSNDVESKIKEAADEVVKQLGLDDLKEQLKKFNEKKEKKGEKKSKALIDLEVLMQKDVNQMTTREKIIGFFQGMIQSNHVVLKALSEGTAADGGYLFPENSLGNSNRVNCWNILNRINNKFCTRQSATKHLFKRQVEAQRIDLETSKEEYNRSTSARILAN